MVSKLGLHRHNLIPIKMEMYAVNVNNINNLGAAVLRFSGQDRVGNNIETSQVPMSLTHKTGYFSARKHAQ